METRAYAVKRYVFRLGHAAGSARFATSIEQLVVGLAPVLGWGAVPRAGAARARFVRAHRKSVQRWLDDLQVAGLVAHEPERDGEGRWWRTQIVLLAAPAPAPGELAAAAARQRSRRTRGRRRPRRAASHAGIRRRSVRPTARTQAQVARARVFAWHEQRRRAAVEAALAKAYEARGDGEVRTHPFGAPPTSAQLSASSKRSERAQALRSSGSAWTRSAPTLASPPTFEVKTGARAPAGAEATGDLPVPAFQESFDAFVLRRVAERRSQEEGRVALHRAAVSARARELVDSRPGTSWPFWRLREAWAAARYGLDEDSAAIGGSVRIGGGARPVARRLAFAVGLYEQFGAERPPGWPASGAGALVVLGGQRRAATLAGDVARLLILGKQMRAVALERDTDRLRRQARRAEQRARPVPDRLGYRAALAPRWETSEQRRLRVRDAVLRAGGDPAAWPNADSALARYGDADPPPALVDVDAFQALDGIGARAARYGDELARGVYRLPPTWAHLFQALTDPARRTS